MHWDGFPKNVSKSLELSLGSFKIGNGPGYRCDYLSRAVLVQNERKDSETWER